MGRVLLGVLIGIALAVGYVRYELALPDWLLLPDRLRGNIVATAIEDALYDLDADPDKRRRALEVFLDNRAADAAQADAEAGHPLLAALHARRASREARLLAGEWPAYAAALAKSELRAALERRHATTDEETLKRRMLAAGLDGKPFLKRWLERHPPAAGEDLLATLRRLGAQ